MIRSSVKELMCEDALLEQLMNIPISEILHYRDMADSVDTEEALRFLADRFIDNCGVSLGMRGFYDYCASYWEERLDLENNPALSEKYHGAETLIFYHAGVKISRFLSKFVTKTEIYL